MYLVKARASSVDKCACLDSLHLTIATVQRVSLGETFCPVHARDAALCNSETTARQYRNGSTAWEQLTAQLW